MIWWNEMLSQATFRPQVKVAQICFSVHMWFRSGVFFFIAVWTAHLIWSFHLWIGPLSLFCTPHHTHLHTEVGAFASQKATISKSDSLSPRRRYRFLHVYFVRQHAACDVFVIVLLRMRARSGLWPVHAEIWPQKKTNSLNIQTIRSER